MVSNSREHVNFLDDGIDESAAALDDAEPASALGAIRIEVAVLASGNYQHLIGPDLGVATKHHPQDDEASDTQQNDDERNPASAKE